MEPTTWLLIGLTIALIVAVGIIIFMVIFIRGTTKALFDFTIIPWLKGNFGKRGE